MQMLRLMQFIDRGYLIFVLHSGDHHAPHPFLPHPAGARMSAPALPDGRYGARLAALSLTMLLPSLGISIANVALPTLAASYQVTMAEVQWVVIGYLLAVTSLIVSAGRLGDLVGRRRLLLGGIGVFALASGAAALAPGLWVLVAARAVQGAGAAVMMALTIALVGGSVPKHRTGSAMGLLGTMSAVGTALGPPLGGALIALFGWPAVFAVLATMGGATLLIGHRLFPPDAPAVRGAGGFDGRGTVLLALSLMAFMAALTLGARLPTPALTALGAAAVIGFAAFLRHLARAPAPLVRLDLLRDGSLRAGLAALALVSAIVMATLVVGPFYLSGVLGLGSFATGLAMSAGPVVSALTGAPAGRLVDRIGSQRVMTGGLLAMITGAAALTLLPAQSGVAGYLGGLIVVTFGYALFQAANTTAIMQATPDDRRGVTSALLGLARNLGLIAGASAMGAVYALGPAVASGLGLWAGPGAGLRLTFLVAASLAATALGLTLRQPRRG